LASSINASTTAGLVNTADTSGVLQLQTAGTTAISIDASQAVTMAGRTTNPTTISVGNATPSTSGAGITFPATQSASTNANTLDDYEEGTWSPTLVNCGSGTVVSANYLRIGNIVTIRMTIVSGTFTSNSSNFTLPFSSIGIGSGTFSIATTVGGFIEPQASNICYFVTTASGNAHCSATYITT